MNGLLIFTKGGFFMKQFVPRRWLPGIPTLRMSTTVLVGTGMVVMAIAFAPGLTWGGPPAPGSSLQKPGFDYPSLGDNLTAAPEPTERFELVYGVYKSIGGFKVLYYTAVKDNETGLVWERAPGDLNGDGEVDVNAESEDRVTWLGAHQACISKTTGGKSGWQLPKLYETQSLITLNNSDPNTIALPLGHPFQNIISGFLLNAYWTATSTIGQPGFAWAITFPSGTPVSQGKGGSLFTWCVQGPN